MKPGDVVRLKSGGPQMTISGIKTKDNTQETAICVWSFQDVLNHAELPILAIEPVKKQ
jgi:uncharacterized protein YodC (DUF2158 family)